jgi:hypothetical protein
MSRFFIGLALVLAVAAGGAFYLLQRETSFSVVFTDAKKLNEGDIVYLSGNPVGRVLTVSPENGKVRIGVHIDRKYRDRLTGKSTFFIGRDAAIPGHMSLLARTPFADKGSQLTSEDKVEGIDSFLVWSSLEMADKISGAIRSEPWQPLVQELGFIAQDFNKAVTKIDIDRLGLKFRSDIENLSNEIDKALQNHAVKNSLFNVQNQTEQILDRLKELGDSEESRQLQIALKNFQNRIAEEIHRQENGT